MQEAAQAAPQLPTFFSILIQWVYTLLVNAPLVAAVYFVMREAVKRGVIAGRKAELKKKEKPSLHNAKWPRPEES